MINGITLYISKDDSIYLKREIEYLILMSGTSLEDFYDCFPGIAIIHQELKLLEKDKPIIEKLKLIK